MQSPSPVQKPPKKKKKPTWKKLAREPKDLGDETRMEYLMEEIGQPTKRKLKVTNEEVFQKDRKRLYSVNGQAGEKVNLSVSAVLKDGNFSPTRVGIPHPVEVTRWLRVT
jgi:hypothetical protein